jgi:hypothetical protein
MRPLLPSFFLGLLAAGLFSLGSTASAWDGHGTLVPSAPSGTETASPQQSWAHGPHVTPAGCDVSAVPGVVWAGSRRRMTLRELAAYVAPVYWFSPDEPTLEGRSGREIALPNALPFEPQPEGPVVYFQFNEIYERVDRDGPGVVLDAADKGSSTVDLNNIAGARLEYIAYFKREEGLGGHPHDVEPTELRIWIGRANAANFASRFGVKCSQLEYLIGVSRVAGEAHGIEWFWNVLEPDVYTHFPMHMLVEEGKHGMCTDKNADGYYTPGFDVNVRINDAWGVRDIIRGGVLFTGSYQSWMTKVRRPEHQVFPPLPDDSPLRGGLSEGGVYAPHNAVYELRPFPPSERADDDELLRHKMHEKESRGWPTIEEFSDVKQVGHWLEQGLALKSLSIAFRTEGAGGGFAWVFPLLIVKNIEDPLTGGFITQRMYLEGHDFDTFGWMLHYSPSASRWMDGYFSGGVEWRPVTDASGVETTEPDFVFETGVKFRVTITKTPLKFLGVLTPFWGLRVGIKNTGAFQIDHLNYVVEFGAGVW